MESDSLSDPRHPNGQVTEQIATAASPTDSVEASKGSIFNNAQNTYIANGSFNITTNNMVQEQQTKALDMLYKRVAPNAILNAGGRADEVRCHPGTRKEVLGRIGKWKDDPDRQTPPIFWLSGPAGAGKTAIVQTIAEDYKAQGVPQANFFFFRTDPSRNNLSPLIATLVHQIILLYPALRVAVADVLSTNPLIFDGVLEDQLMQLVVLPLQTVQQSSPSYVPPLLLIDGLDECESEGKLGQRRILQAFDNILAEHPSLFRLLVASRDESQIRAAFNNISSRLFPLYLDDQYKPEDDIRAFVIDEFKQIQKTHPLAPTLDASWPSVKDIDDIVRKSSGQFIYAATVMRFIMASSVKPSLSLARIKGVAEIPAKSKSPFSQLDAIYTYILSQVADQEALKDILHAQLLVQAVNVEKIRTGPLLQVYNSKYTRAVIESCLADVTPLARYTHSGNLSFYHASFPDYLLNSSRSEDYFVDLHAFNFRIQPELWKAYDKEWRRNKQLFRWVAVPGIMKLSEIPPGFLDLVTTPLQEEDWSGFGVKSADLFKHLHSLCDSDDDMMKYKRIVHEWANNRTDGRISKLKGGRGLRHWPPYARRYAVMRYFGSSATLKMHHGIESENLDNMIPKTAADVPETAAWLTTVLCDIHKEMYRTRVEDYNALLRQLTGWAVHNNIPLDDVDDLPNARWYRAMANIEHDVTVDIALHREEGCDIPETAAWLTALLHRIHGEKYHTNVSEYNRLVRKWTSWATRNDIPLDAVEDLPSAWWYLLLSRIGRWLESKFGLDSNPQ